MLRIPILLMILLMGCSTQDLKNDPKTEKGCWEQHAANTELIREDFGS